MATLSSLRTRLAQRSLKGTLSSALSSLADEALNSAAVSIASQGTQYGIAKRDFAAELWGKLDTGIASSVTKGSTTLTLSGATLTSDNVYPGDFLEDTFSGSKKRFLVYEVNSDTAFHIGGEARANATGTDADIYRRTIKLPSTGGITGVAAISDGGDFQRDLKPAQSNARVAPFLTGEPTHYSIAYDQQSDATFLSVYPVPSSAQLLLIQQAKMPAKLVNDGDDLDWHESALYALLEIAHQTLQTWLKAYVGPVDAQAIELARKRALPGITKTSTTRSVLSR